MSAERRLGESEYAELVLRVQEAVAGLVPGGASALVLSKGDESLLAFPGLRASHFPQDELGGYAGYYPRDDAEAVAELQRLQRAGAEYLVIPATGRWWLEFYAGFAHHLGAHCELVADIPDACLVFRLGTAVADLGGGVVSDLPRAGSEQMRDYLENLLSTDTDVAVLDLGSQLAGLLAPVAATSFEFGEYDSDHMEGLAHLARQGVEYLVVPRAADEWLDGHPEVAAEIEACCRKIADQRHLCRVYELKELRAG